MIQFASGCLQGIAQVDQGDPTSKPMSSEFQSAKTAARKSRRAPYVVQHPQTGRWFCSQLALGATYATQEEVARALQGSAAGKAILAKAKKKGPATARGTPPRELVRRVLCLSKFTFGSAKRKWLPADALAAKQHRERSKDMFQAEPVLHFLSLQLAHE